MSSWTDFLTKCSIQITNLANHPVVRASIQGDLFVVWVICSNVAINWKEIWTSLRTFMCTQNKY